jgi:hypothetical protein
MKIAILIPSTSKNRIWRTYQESYLFKNTIKTFLVTYNQEHCYKFFIGIDKDDPVYDNKEIQSQILRFIQVMNNIELEFIYMENIPKGHLTKMWNVLYDRALEENYDYFFQCGDDIEFHTKNWINDCIQVLEKTNGIGLVGPINNNPRILTQSFVSRKHKDLFGYFFPPNIINWFCDDWINEVYKKIGHFYPLNNHFCNNVGGKPRYDINNDKTFRENPNEKVRAMREHCMKIVERDTQNLVKNSILK